MVVRLTDAWVEILRRRASAHPTAAYPLPVQNLLGEMVAAATLMQSNIKFNGSLILQIFGDGPVKLAVVEVQPDLGLRATATVSGDVAADASLSMMVNVNNEGKCAITLDPQTRNANLAMTFGSQVFGDQPKPDLMESSAALAEEIEAAGMRPIFQVVPWYFSGGDPNDLSVRRDSLLAFGESVIAALS